MNFWTIGRSGVNISNENILARNTGDAKVVDTVKQDVMVSSSLARTRRLLQTRAKMENRDPAQALRDRISQIKTKEENDDVEIKGWIDIFRIVLSQVLDKNYI